MVVTAGFPDGTELTAERDPDGSYLIRADRTGGGFHLGGITRAEATRLRDQLTHALDQEQA